MSNLPVLPVFRRSFGDSWRSLVAWGVGVSAALLLYLPLFPSIGGSGQMQQLIASLPPELVRTLGYEDIVSGVGYTQATFFGLIGFFLFIFAATAWGSAAIAGAEESGVLELTLAHGVGRGQYASESVLSVLARLVALGALSGGVILALNSPSDLGISITNLLAALAALVGLACVSATVALLVGASTGRRVFATSAGAGVAVLGYVFNALANQVPNADWLRWFSPYSWAYHEAPLRDGASWIGLALLWGVSLCCVAATAVVLRRRDISG